MDVLNQAIADVSSANAAIPPLRTTWCVRHRHRLKADCRCRRRIFSNTIADRGAVLPRHITPSRPGWRGSSPLAEALALTAFWRARDVQGHRRRRRHDSEMGVARPVRAELFLDRAVLLQQHRWHVSLLRRPPPPAAPTRLAPRPPSSCPSTTKRRAAFSLLCRRFSRMSRRPDWLSISTGFSSRTPQIPTSGSPRSAPSSAPPPAWGRGRTRLLPAARKEHEPQGRQYRGFRLALGRRL